MIALHNPPFINFVYSHGFAFYVIPKLLKLLKTAENGEIYGTLGGISTAVSLTRAQKVWRILPAIGDIAFAFPFSPLVLEIQVYLNFYCNFQLICIYKSFQLILTIWLSLNEKLCRIL